MHDAMSGYVLLSYITVPTTFQNQHANPQQKGNACCANANQTSIGSRYSNLLVMCAKCKPLPGKRIPARQWCDAPYQPEEQANQLSPPVQHI